MTPDITRQLSKHLVLMELNANHREICECYMCLGKKLASELNDSFRAGNSIKWTAGPKIKRDFDGGFFRRIRDAWLK